MKLHISKAVLLFCFGGTAYCVLEVLWRGYSHWTMFILGGLLFVFIGGLNNYLPWDMSFVAQCCIGAAMVTGTELVSGIILNIWLGLNIWDYSHMWGNVLGQICPQFSLLWIVLSGVAIVADDMIRHYFWGDPFPHYRLFRRNNKKG